MANNGLVLLCGIHIWDVEGVQQDNILPTRADSKTSPVYLVLVGWKVLFICFVNVLCVDGSVFSDVSKVLLQTWS